MNIRFLIFLLSLFAAFAATSMAQTVKHESAPTTSPSSGKEMFNSYCASCHGKDAKGNGPAASALKQLPADLTALSIRNGGKYPADKVASVLRGQANLMAHGDQEMPVWGPVFWRMSQGHDEQVQMRITNLNKYLESLQQK